MILINFNVIVVCKEVITLLDSSIQAEIFFKNCTNSV